MPAFAHHFAVDWNWSALSNSDREMVRRLYAGLRADPSSLTVDYFSRMLADATEGIGRDVLLSAAVEDENGRWLIRASNGNVELTPAEEQPEIYSKLLQASPSDLFPETLTLHDFRAAGVNKIVRSHYYREDVLERLRAEAIRADRSMSWMMQHAWSIAYAELAALEGDTALDALSAERLDSRRGRVEKQSLYYPLELVEQLEQLSLQHDCSESKLMQLAWMLAEEEIAKLPAADDFV